MQKQKTEIEWQNIKIAISYEPNKHAHISHVQVESENNQRLPFTETGYRSIFESEEFIKEFENVQAYVKAQLDEAAKSKEWQKHLKNKGGNQNQLSFF